MATAVKLATEMERTFSNNFYNTDVTKEIEVQLEKVADLYLEKFFSQENNL